MVERISFHRLPGAIDGGRWPEGARSVLASPTFVRRHAGPWIEAGFSCHDEWELTVCLHGRGCLEGRCDRCPLHPGGFVLIPPGLAHRECGRPGLDTLWIGWRGSFAADLSAAVQHWEGTDLIPLAERLWSESLRSGGGDGPMLDGLLLAILGGLRRPATGGLDPRLAAIIADCQREFHRPWSVAAMARRAGLSRDRFARVFRAATGSTPVRYLAWLRCDAAKRLLADGLSVSETAHLVGYADPAYFSRVFRRCVGAPPRAVGALAAKRPAAGPGSTRSAAGPTRG
jgi:AraC-like DNA-binding protein